MYSLASSNQQDMSGRAFYTLATISTCVLISCSSLVLPRPAAVAVISGCIGISLFSIRPWVGLTGAVLILVCIPGELQIALTGMSYALPTGQINLHVLTYYIFGGTLETAFEMRDAGLAWIAKRRFIERQLKLFGILFLFEFVLEISKVRGSGLSNQLADVYLGPMCLYIIMVLTIDRFPRTIQFIEDAVIILLLPVVIFGFFEFWQKANPLMGNLFLDQAPWYSTYQDEFAKGQTYRISTILGHPLTNSYFFFFASLLAFRNSRLFHPGKSIVWRYVLCAVLFFIGILLTASRTSSLLWICSAGILVYRSPSGEQQSLRTVGSVAAFALLIALCLPLVQGIVERGIDDSSALARVASVQGVVSAWTSIPFLGFGPGSIEDVKIQFLSTSTGTSFEIGWIIVLIQFGYLFVLLYFAVLVVPLKESLSRRYAGSNDIFLYRLVVIMMILIFASSNTIGERSTINYLFFLALGLLGGKMIVIQNAEYPSIRAGQK